MIHLIIIIGVTGFIDDEHEEENKKKEKQCLNHKILSRSTSSR